ALVHAAAAQVLSYPDADLLARLAVIEAALADTWAAALFAPVLAHLRSPALNAPKASEPAEALTALQSYHVQEFDLSRRHALHLTYWTEGDTRRRGEVLASIKTVYRESGLVVDTGGELFDYLPMLCEFCVHDPERGLGLLTRFRPNLELLRLGCTDDGLPHAGVLEAVCRTVPGPRPADRAEIQAMVRAVAPTETVGFDPYSPTYVGWPELSRS
ncbi:MAG: molecular chaperone TorD family protein, partial [Propionibacteriaceae bacterium]|nr:molecular chaperone TorD family protein [Propionibacteriaceae bacterium]